VHVPAKAAVEFPIQLLFLATGGKPVVSHPRNLIVVDREARASIVETYAALDDGAYWTNAVTEIVLGDGARVDYHRVQQESSRAYHVATTQSHQGRDSTLNLHFVAFGGKLARHDIGAVMAGPGGTLILNGLYLLGDQQHADHHTTIDHAADHCESHEYFNGVLDEKSRGVFTGRIIVRPGAQKTDSKQTNNNLLLSADAHADSQPQLEIYADDVKCTHGSTVGPLDPRALFYLRSRGMGEDEARRLLTYGFAAEILGRMDVAALRAELDRIVRDRLAA
jgi:Fe-S cluster assembly protein SufD